MDDEHRYREEMEAITFTHEPSLAELRETEAVYTRAMEYLWRMV